MDISSMTPAERWLEVLDEVNWVKVYLSSVDGLCYIEFDFGDEFHYVYDISFESAVIECLSIIREIKEIYKCLSIAREIKEI